MSSGHGLGLGIITQEANMDTTQAHVNDVSSATIDDWLLITLEAIMGGLHQHHHYKSFLDPYSPQPDLEYRHVRESTPASSDDEGRFQFFLLGHFAIRDIKKLRALDFDPYNTCMKYLGTAEQPWMLLNIHAYPRKTSEGHTCMSYS
ncbi:hypothetical protein ABVK25_001482 [Lepraria finkii]|uniref:Uncharacterized protein n=1 Tax=Lepraria finkii TaxID=1340010 RepID=A0ABR4BJG4_9LECA